jgi:hypothetical protein
MQTSTRLLSLISTQQSLLIFKDNQTERLSAELKRIEQSKQPYHIAVGVKVALKLIAVADKAGAEISDLLQSAYEKTAAHQKMELTECYDDLAKSRLRNAQRKVQAMITAAGYMQAIHTAIANRATENLCQAHLLIVGADGNGSTTNYLPGANQLTGQLAELKNLTMSYAHDMAEYGELIEKHDSLSEDDGFEFRTQKEALHRIQAFTNGLMETAISMVDTSISSLTSINNVSDAHKKEQTEWLAAFGVASSSLAKFAAQMLNEAIGSLGTVTVVARVTSSMVTSRELYGDLTKLTSNNTDYRLN